MEDVLDLHEEPYDPQRPTVCFDETSTQLIRAYLSQPGRDGESGSTMSTGATAPDLFMLCEPLRGWRHVAVTET